MKLRYQILIGILLTLIQGIVFNFFGNSAFFPNVILVITIVGVFVENDVQKWLIIGWIAAILRDISLSIYIGIGSLSLIVTVGLLLLLMRWISNENVLGVCIDIVLGTAIYNSFYWVISALVVSSYSYSFAFKHWVYQLPLNILLGLAFYYFVGRAEKARRKKERFRYYL
ncbi:hypothetical protein HMPREF1635_00625 [Clostridiales bacterium S5-A14a]|nr:hypothetical protein HMPREF1635_00625 [Clostridiales bacterium S5-A14a]